MTKSELHQLIIKTEEYYEKQKSKRAVVTCLGYGITIFVILAFLNDAVGITSTPSGIW